MLLAFLVGLAMVVAAGAGLAMLIDPDAFLTWSGSDCGETGECSTSDLRILGAILAFVVGPAGVALFLRSAPWRDR
jgi:hypothetical protein